MKQRWSWSKERRTERVSVRVTPSEKLALLEAALSAGTTPADFDREALMRGLEALKENP